MTWTPITLEELSEKISSQLPRPETPEFRLWTMIRISPEKWVESEYGDEGGGFWVVALIGTNADWYNDIEEGFNISPFATYGKIDGCGFEQYELRHVLFQLSRFINDGTHGVRW